jgi:hypothetical protein
MLGVASYQICRDCALLWPNRTAHALLSRSEVKTLYCVAMFRHLQYGRGRAQVLTDEIIRFISDHTDAQIWSVVALAGGSREDCDHGIEEILVRRNQHRIQQETINVESTVA